MYDTDSDSVSSLSTISEIQRWNDAVDASDTVAAAIAAAKGHILTLGIYKKIRLSVSSWSSAVKALGKRTALPSTKTQLNRWVGRLGKIEVPPGLQLRTDLHSIIVTIEGIRDQAREAYKEPERQGGDDAGTAGDGDGDREADRIIPYDGKTDRRDQDTFTTRAFKQDQHFRMAAGKCHKCLNNSLLPDCFFPQTTKGNQVLKCTRCRRANRPCKMPDGEGPSLTADRAPVIVGLPRKSISTTKTAARAITGSSKPDNQRKRRSTSSPQHPGPAQRRRTSQTTPPSATPTPGVASNTNSIPPSAPHSPTAVPTTNQSSIPYDEINTPLPPHDLGTPAQAFKDFFDNMTQVNPPAPQVEHASGVDQAEKLQTSYLSALYSPTSAPRTLSERVVASLELLLYIMNHVDEEQARLDREERKSLLHLKVAASMVTEFMKGIHEALEQEPTTGTTPSWERISFLAQQVISLSRHHAEAQQRRRQQLDALNDIDIDLLEKITKKVGDFMHGDGPLPGL